MVDHEGVDRADLDLADKELVSLLRKCEAVRIDTLSPARQTLMTNRVAALRTAIELVTDARSRVTD